LKLEAEDLQKTVWRTFSSSSTSIQSLINEKRLRLCNKNTLALNTRCLQQTFRPDANFRSLEVREPYLKTTVQVYVIDLS